MALKSYALNLLDDRRTIILIFFRNILHGAQTAHPLGGLPVLIVGAVGAWCFHVVVVASFIFGYSAFSMVDGRW
jgi:hypothetical protein